MIFDKDGSSEFVSRVTALNVEDMENASMRLAKSLINRKGINESLDINNIVENLLTCAVVYCERNSSNLFVTFQLVNLKSQNNELFRMSS